MKSAIDIIKDHDIPAQQAYSYVLQLEAERRARTRITTLWQPTPGPQQRAYESAADVLFYGGAAGGGKTDLMVGLAMTKHRKSVIFRREYTQLRDVVTRINEIRGSVGRFNGQTSRWVLPGNRQIELGAVKNAQELSKYKGRPHDFKAYDEGSDFKETWFRFLNGWLRTTVPGQRTRVVIGGNPPTNAEGEWVIRHFAPWLDPGHGDPALPGELRWYAMVDKNTEMPVESGAAFYYDGKEIKPKSRTFIPALLTDNPYITEDYASTLQAMPEPLRSQLLYGRFDIKMEDDPWQCIPTAWVDAAMERWRKAGGIDYRHIAGPMTTLGADIAHGGNDKTALAPRHGVWFAPITKIDGALTPDGSTAATAVLNAHEGTASINVDMVGWGASAYELLRDSSGFQVNGVSFGESGATGTGADQYDASGRLKLVNVRAVCYWRMREALDPMSGMNLMLPDDRELKADLCAPRWYLTPQGVVIEAKDHVKARLGRSPDCGDAAVLALFEPRPSSYDYGAVGGSRPQF